HGALFVGEAIEDAFQQRQPLTLFGERAGIRLAADERGGLLLADQRSGNGAAALARDAEADAVKPGGQLRTSRELGQLAVDDDDHILHAIADAVLSYAEPPQAPPHERDV